MDELSKKRLALLGYELYKRCSEGELVSDKELLLRLKKIQNRYPDLTLSKLINECQFKSTSDKFKETTTYSTKVMDRISDENILPKDVLEHVLSDYIGYDDTVTYYPDGKIHKEFQHIGETKMGKYKEYYPNGKLGIELTFLDDEPHGEEKTYHQENGRLFSQSFFKNGKLNGESKQFSLNGKLQKLSNYKDDKLDGLETSYVDFNAFGFVPRDNPVEETFYKNGRKIWSKLYYPSGSLREHIIYNRFRPNTIKAWRRDGTPITDPNESY